MNFSPASQSTEISLIVGGVQTEEDGERRGEIGTRKLFPTRN